MISNEFRSKEPAFESCVLCGSRTEIPMDLNIEMRTNYIAGIGQLCDKCAIMLLIEERMERSKILA